MSIFADRLKELRGQESQASFAEQLGLNRVQYFKYESGKNSPSIDVLTKICRVHAVSADWLLGLPERANSAHISGDGNAVAVGTNAKAKISKCATQNPECSKCKYKKLADAFKAL